MSTFSTYLRCKIHPRVCVYTCVQCKNFLTLVSGRSPAPFCKHREHTLTDKQLCLKSTKSNYPWYNYKIMTMPFWRSLRINTILNILSNWQLTVLTKDDECVCRGKKKRICVLISACFLFILNKQHTRTMNSVTHTSNDDARACNSIIDAKMKHEWISET